MITDRQLFENYRADVFSICYYMVHNRHDAEDLCQDIFFKALQQDRTKIMEIKPWLIRIAIHTCRNWLRRKKLAALKNSVLLRQQQAADTDNATDLSWSRKESTDALARWLATLPEKIRITLTLKYVNELKIPEIAVILKIPAGTVKSRINKGLKLLKQTEEAADFLAFKGGTLIERNH